MQEDLDNEWQMYSDIAMIAYQEGLDLHSANQVGIKVLQKIFDVDITTNPKHIEMVG